MDQQGSQSKLQQENSKLARQISTLKEDKEDLEKDVEELRPELIPMKKENRILMLENKVLKLELQRPEVMIFDKQSTSLSQFRRNLGKLSCHSKRPSYWPRFSASCSRTRRESESAASHEKHRETGSRVLEVLDKIFRAKFIAQK